MISKTIVMKQQFTMSVYAITGGFEGGALNNADKNGWCLKMAGKIKAYPGAKVE